MRVFLSICILFLSALPALAQAPVPDSADIHPAARYDFTSGPHYKRMAAQALAQPADFNFSVFRLLYSMTRPYDPVAEKAQREVLALSEQVRKAANKEDRKKAQDAYMSAIMTHLASIDVVAMALAMAEEDSRFGDPEFFKWIHRGLLESILDSGNGNSLEDAYDALTLGEETVLLRKLGVKVLASRAFHKGAVYYNHHETEDRKTGVRREIFVDVTKPMTYLEWEKGRKNRAVSLPRR